MPFDVEVTVTEVKKKCAFGYKVGDKILFNGKKIKGNVCFSALMTVLPKVYAMLYGAEFPWAKIETPSTMLVQTQKTLLFLK